MNKYFHKILLLFFILCFAQGRPVKRDHLEQMLAEKGIKRNKNLLSVLYHLEEDELAQICPETLEKIIVFLSPLSAFFSLEEPFVEQTRFKLFEFLNYLMPKRLIFLIVSALPLAECGSCGQFLKEIFECVAQRLFTDTNYFQIRFDDENTDRFNLELANEFFDGSISPRLKAILGHCQSRETIKVFVSGCVEAIDAKRIRVAEFGHFNVGQLWFFTRFQNLLNE